MGLRYFVSLLTIWVAALASASGFAQAYPSRTIRIVTSDLTNANGLESRLIAEAISGPLGQSVIVDPRGGVVPATLYAQKAAPDGYTVLLAGNGMWWNPVAEKTSYDPIKDFAPVTIVSTSPLILAVNSSLPVNSVKELIDLAKARPGQLNYAAIGSSGANGTHIAGALLKSMAGIDIVLVPYKSSGQASAAVVSGEVQFMFNPPATSMPLIKAGKVKALALTSPASSPLYPGLPPIADTLSGFVSQETSIMFAPAGTPVAIINRLNQEMVRAIKSPEVKEKILNLGVEAAGTSPEQATSLMKSDMAIVAKIIKDEGIRVEQ